MSAAADRNGKFGRRNTNIVSRLSLSVRWRYGLKRMTSIITKICQSQHLWDAKSILAIPDTIHAPWNTSHNWPAWQGLFNSLLSEIFVKISVSTMINEELAPSFRFPFFEPGIISYAFRSEFLSNSCTVGWLSCLIPFGLSGPGRWLRPCWWCLCRWLWYCWWFPSNDEPESESEDDSSLDDSSNFRGLW